MSRRIARETAMKILYQFDVIKTESEEKSLKLDEFFEQLKINPPALPVHLVNEKFIDDLEVAPKDFVPSDYISNNDEKYIRDIFSGIYNELDNIDELISKYAKGWKLNRIPRVDLAILRLSIYEMKYRDDIPVKVSINESVELAKKFSSSESPSFINAVLGSISRNE